MEEVNGCIRIVLIWELKIAIRINIANLETRIIRIKEEFGMKGKLL